jgi:hypothetical protein
MITTMSAENKSNKRRRHLSPESLARIRAGARRRIKHPEVYILMERAKVGYCHAYRLARGINKSVALEAMLVDIRAELAAKNQTVSA